MNNPLYSVHDSTNIVQSFSHQLLKKMSFKTLLSDSVALSKILEDISITEVEVTYKDGSTEVVEIGEIRFMEWEAPSEAGQAPIDLVGVASYDNQLSKYEFRVHKDILLLDVESNFNHQMKRDFQFYINDHEEMFESLPLTIESNRLSITIKSNEEESDPFSVYDVKPKLVYETTEGDLGFVRFHHVQQPYLSKSDIKELLKEER